MQALYQHDMWERSRDGSLPAAAPAAGAAGEAVFDAEAADRFIDSATNDPEVRDFARTLYHGAVEIREVADRLLGEVADRWKLERIAAIDRAILRLAIFELLELDEIPVKVAINEAIELAKKYSTAQSGGFVNGLLDRLSSLRDGDSREPRRC